jgi:hypothetical protein
MLTGITSLELRGLRYGPPAPRVHLLAPVTRRPRTTDRVLVTRTRTLPRPVTIDGLTHAPTERAVRDACRCVEEPRDCVAIVAEAVQRRWTTVERLEHELAAAHPAGSGTIRRALALVTAGARSAPEADLLVLLNGSSVLPPCRWNDPLTVDGVLLVPDLCWPEARLIVEVDSVEHHGFGPDAEATARRRARLVAAGWTVLSVSPVRVRTDGRAVLVEIERAYLVGVARAAG